jgi:2',3'-cyclic-nucleotide 2'-phosphodiesterase (5'-nucleotidase family)
MNKRTRFIVFLATLCGFGLSSCAPKIPDEVEIVILSSTDIHGYFEHLAKYSAFVKETKAAHKNVIVADAGDRFTGNPHNDYHEKKQFPIVDLLNHLGTDIMVIGNHEFDYGVELLNERIKETEGVVILANIDLKGSGLKGVKPYHIIKKNGLKIAFLGLTHVDEYTGTPPVLAKRIDGLNFYEPRQTAAKYRYLRKKSHVFVALTHIGMDNNRILADSMPELDLIVSGHVHALFFEPEIQNGVMITQTGKHASHIGKTTILLKKGVVSQVTNEVIDLTTWDGLEDPVIAEKIRMYEENPFLKEPFATLQHEISNVEQLSYMMTDAMITLPDVDFSIINLPGIKIDYLLAGSLTYGDILRLSPHNNYLVVVGLKPSEIRDIFEKRGRIDLSPAGFEYVARKTSNGSMKVDKLMFPNGEELDETKTYYLAIDNFLFSMYLMEHTDRAEHTGVLVVDNIVDYLRDNPNVDYRNAPVRMRYE